MFTFMGSVHATLRSDVDAFVRDRNFPAESSLKKHLL